MGKSPRKVFRAEVSAKRAPKYPSKARKTAYSVPPLTGGKSIPTRRFSLVDSDSDSDSPLSNVSDMDPEAEETEFLREDAALGLASGNEENELASGSDAEYWRTATAEVDAIMGTSSSENESDYGGMSSSSDDSDVDFVKLTAERKARAMKSTPVFQTHGVKRPPTKTVRRPRAIKGPPPTAPELPDLEYEFEFDQDDHLVYEPRGFEPEPEDLGEELLGNPHGEVRSNCESNFSESPQNSSDDYELDDTALLATLAADEDHEAELLDSSDESESDFNDDLDEEETKQLMYEMDDADVDDDLLLQQEHDHILADLEGQPPGPYARARTQPHFDDESNKQSVAASIDMLNQTGLVKQFVYSDDDSELEDYEFGLDGDDSQAALDVDETPFVRARPVSVPAPRARARADSDDDDLYLWNYFFSLAESELGDEKPELSLMTAQAYEAPAAPPAPASPAEARGLIYNDLHEPHPDLYLPEAFSGSGESTDEDHTLPPPSARPPLGSKRAQEVWSLSRVGTRPPVLGTWVTRSGKPYEIIDGLSTRTLTPVAEAPLVEEPLADESALQLDELFHMSDLEDSLVVVPNAPEEMGAWDAFDRARKVPLLAFRNKGIVAPALPPAPNMRRYSLSATNRRRPSATASATAAASATASAPATEPATAVASPRSRKASHVPPASPAVGTWSEEKSIKKMARLNRRRQSMAEAAAEGMRSTKSGLFSEETLQGVEALLADLEAGDVGELFKEF